MKILLLGDYSGLHLTLSEGLRILGHDVTVASDGDGFKNYPRDIDLKRESSNLKDTLANLLTISSNLRNFKGYDVVQITNPCFTTQNIRVNIELYRYLRRHNKKIFLGAFGDDYFWIKACLDQKYKYSEFYIGNIKNTRTKSDFLIENWIGTKREDANVEMADSCNGIVACLYEYYEAYKDSYGDKLKYIPLPVNTGKVLLTELPSTDKINFFIGINKARNEFKGTDILYEVLQQIAESYPNDSKVTKVESVMYSEYLSRIKDAHVVLDQLYSYSPAMNGLLTMALGKVLVGGGESDMYDLLQEQELQPIVNVYPDQEDIYRKLEDLILHKETIKQRAKDGRLFVEKHHDYLKVAQQYLDFWNSK